MIKGKAHVYGDNIDTDAIIPARYLNSTDPDFLAAHCMEDIDAQFPTRVRPGDVVTGGRNFGCGSSREHAPLALRASGVACVIAESFARIFFRNSVNTGLPLVECAEAARDARPGDDIEVDLAAGLVRNLTRGREYGITPYPPFMQELVAAGGLVEYTRAKMKKSPR